MQFLHVTFIAMSIFASGILAAPLKNTIIFPHEENVIPQGDVTIAHGLVIKPDGDIVLKAGARLEESCHHSACLQVTQ